MILCIGTTPAAQRVMVFEHVTIDAVNRAATTHDGAAGKSINVAKVLRALGEEPVAVGFLGGDRGAELLRILRDRAIECDFVEVTARTRQCVTVIDRSRGTQTELVEESPVVEPEDYAELQQGIGRRLHTDCEAVVMSGTLAPGGPVDFYARNTRLAHQAGALSIIDAQGAALSESLKEQPGLIKPNRAELAATVARKLDDEGATLSAMRGLHTRGAQRVVVTSGKQPILAFDGTHAWRIMAPRIAPVNPIGSGDAFTAGLVRELIKGNDLGEACRWGCAAGTANALTPMAGEVERPTVERLAPEVTVERL